MEERIKAREGIVYEDGRNTVVCIGIKNRIVSFAYPSRDNVSRIMRVFSVEESDLEISGNAIKVHYPIRITNICTIGAERKGIFAVENVRSILNPERFSELEKKFNSGEIIE